MHARPHRKGGHDRHTERLQKERIHREETRVEVGMGDFLELEFRMVWRSFPAEHNYYTTQTPTQPDNMHVFQSWQTSSTFKKFKNGKKKKKSISKEPTQTDSKLSPHILSTKDFRAKLLSSWRNSSQSENFLPHNPRIFSLVIHGKEQGEIISGHGGDWEHTIRGN